MSAKLVTVSEREQGMRTALSGHLITICTTGLTRPV